jgi:hypothetical protein
MIETADADVRSRFGYRRSTEPWRIGVMDPNITVMKTSHLPMLVCEAAFRRQPEAFRAMFITNSWQFREKPHFSSFFLSLESAKAGVMTSEARFVGPHFIANHCEAVVTHHWENGLNYLYYEVLYGGYPLIHNSEFLKEYGYYYKDFDAESGADALLRAYAEHNDQLENYKRKNAELLRRLNPRTPETIAIHEALLGRGVHRRQRRAQQTNWSRPPSAETSKPGSAPGSALCRQRRRLTLQARSTRTFLISAPRSDTRS